MTKRVRLTLSIPDIDTAWVQAAGYTFRRGSFPPAQSQYLKLLSRKSRALRASANGQVPFELILVRLEMVDCLLLRNRSSSLAEQRPSDKTQAKQLIRSVQLDMEESRINFKGHSEPTLLTKIIQDKIDDRMKALRIEAWGADKEKDSAEGGAPISSVPAVLSMKVSSWADPTGRARQVHQLNA